MIKRTSGFTVIEIIFIVLVLGAASILFFVQKNDLAVANRDQQRKTSINAMYYSLEQVFYKANNYYPETISETNLPSVDPALFTDPNGVKIGASTSNYRYDATNCNDNKCQAYTLRTTLENEADYVKDSINK
jgi:type II secretory pathway pseudopilin PulG